MLCVVALLLWLSFQLCLISHHTLAQLDSTFSLSQPNARCFRVDLTTLSSLSESLTDIYMSHGACIDFCRQHHYPIGLVYQGSTCRCDLSFHAEPVDARHCQLPCTGYPPEICGGSMEESEVRDGHHGGWVYANTLFVDLGSGNDDSSASEEEVPPATSSQLAIPSSVPVTMDSSSVYPNLEAALGESNILISVPVRVASAVSLPSPSSEEDKPEAQEVEYHDQQEVDEEDGSEEDHEDEVLEEHVIETPGPSKSSINGTESSIPTPKQPVSLTIPIAAGASAVVFLTAVATVFICISLRNRRRQAAFLAILEDRRQSAMLERYHAGDPRRQSVGMLASLPSMGEVGVYTHQSAGFGGFGNRQLVVPERDMTMSAPSKEDTQSTNMPVVPSMDNGPRNALNYHINRRSTQRLSMPVSSFAGKELNPNHYSTYVGAPERNACITDENNIQVGLHRHSYPRPPPPVPLSRKRRPVSMHVDTMNSFNLNEKAEVKDLREAQNQFYQPPPPSRQRHSIAYEYTIPYPSINESYRPAAMGYMDGSTAYSEFSNSHSRNPKDLSSSAISSTHLPRPPSVVHSLYSDDNNRPITSPIEAVAVSTISDSLHPHSTTVANQVTDTNPFEAPEYHYPDPPAISHHGDVYVQQHQRERPVSMPPSSIPVLSHIETVSHPPSHSLFSDRNSVGYTPSVGALSSRPSLDYRRHSVASLIRPLEYDYSEDFNDASKGRVLIGRKSSLNSFRPPASLSHVKSSNPTSVSFTSLLEQQRNRQQHLQRLSLPYVQAIRKQQQQHAVQFHGTFVPPALPRRSSAKEHITTLSSIEEASDGSSVVPDLLRTPPARLSITERIKQGSQRIRSHGALAAALARHTDDNQRRDRDMLDDTMNPLGDSLLPSSLSRAYQTTSPHVTTDSDIAAEENEDSTAAGQTTFSVPAQTERRWSRVLKMIAGSGGSEPGVAGLNTRGRRRGAVGQDEASRECKGKGSNEAGRHGMFYSQARHQVDSGSLASFRGLDASPTLRVMNPDDDDPDSLVEVARDRVSEGQ